MSACRWPIYADARLQVKDLGLQEQLLYTSKNSVAAQNRYVYYPDHLVRMPGPGMGLLGNLSNLMTEAAFDGLFAGIIKDIITGKRPEDLVDESVGSFFTRRTSSKIVDNLISAVLHGIYAGDVYSLSMRTLMPWLWNLELRYESISNGFWEASQNTVLSKNDWAMLQALEQGSGNASDSKPNMLDVESSSVFTFKKGLGELSDRLEVSLFANTMVEIRRETLVDNLRLDIEDQKQKVSIPCYRISVLPSATNSENWPRYR